MRQTREEITSQSRIRFQKKVSEDAILSASLWEQLIQLKKEKSNFISDTIFFHRLLPI